MYKYKKLIPINNITQPFFNDIYLYMDIRKIILKEVDDFQWIKDINPQVTNSVIRFEPMINAEEYKNVEPILAALNVVWSSNKQVNETNPFNTYGAQYLHHLIVNNQDRMWWGGVSVDDYDEYEGMEEDEIIRDTEHFDDDINSFIGDYNSINDPRDIDGRDFFNIY